MTLTCAELAAQLGLPADSALAVRVDNDRGVITITAVPKSGVAGARLDGSPRQLAHGTHRMYHTGCRCASCVAGNTRRRDRKAKRANSLTLATAVNYRKQWTGPEMEIAARPDLTAREVAVMLGRSLRGVRGMRTRLQRDPRYRDTAGVSAAERVLGT